MINSSNSRLERRPGGTPAHGLSGAIAIALLSLLAGCPLIPPNGNGNSNSNLNANTNSSTNANANSPANANVNTNVNFNDNSTDPTSVTLRLIAETGGDVPGQPDAATFTAFGDPAIDSAGRIAFWAQFSNGNGAGGLFVWDGDSLENVVDDDSTQPGVVPGRGTQDFFGRFTTRSDFDPFAQPLIWGSGARLVFASPISGSTDSKGLFRWRATDSNLIRICDLEQITELYRAEFGQSVLDLTFRQMYVSDGGIVFFPTSYTLLGTNVPGMIAAGSGVFSSDGRGVTVIRDRLLENASVPGQATSATFASFASLGTQSPAADGFFQATISGGNAQRGLFLARGTTVARVLDNRAGATLSGLSGSFTAGGSTTFADAVAVSNTHIAIDTTLTPTGGQARNTVLLYTWASERWSEVVGADLSNADSLVTGVNDRGQFVYLAGGRPHLVSGATVERLDTNLPSLLNPGALRWEPIGSLTSSGRAALRYTRNPSSTTDAVPGLALWNGAQILVVADSGNSLPANDVFQIGVVQGPERNLVGRTGAINDLNDIAFRVIRRGADNQPSTADDLQAIYLADSQ